MPLNREERRRRIAEEDGDPDDTVHLPQGKSTHVDCYHSSPHCYTIRHDSTVDEVTRETAHQNGKAPCRVCILDDVPDNPGPRLSARLRKMDPEDVGLSPLTDGGDETPTPEGAEGDD